MCESGLASSADGSCAACPSDGSVARDGVSCVACPAGTYEPSTQQCSPCGRLQFFGMWCELKAFASVQCHVCVYMNVYIFVQGCILHECIHVCTELYVTCIVDSHYYTRTVHTPIGTVYQV